MKKLGLQARTKKQLFFLSTETVFGDDVATLAAEPQIIGIFEDGEKTTHALEHTHAHIYNIKDRITHTNTHWYTQTEVHTLYTHYYTQKDIHTERQTDTHNSTYTQKHTLLHTLLKTDRHRQTDSQTHTHTGTHTPVHTHRYTHFGTQIITDRQTDRHTHRGSHISA